MVLEKQSDFPQLVESCQQFSWFSPKPTCVLDFGKSVVYKRQSSFCNRCAISDITSKQICLHQSCQTWLEAKKRDFDFLKCYNKVFIVLHSIPTFLCKNNEQFVNLSSMYAPQFLQSVQWTFHTQLALKAQL
jgi:hypothetical protein